MNKTFFSFFFVLCVNLEASTFQIRWGDKDKNGKIVKISLYDRGFLQIKSMKTWRRVLTIFWHKVLHKEFAINRQILQKFLSCNFQTMRSGLKLAFIGDESRHARRDFDVIQNSPQRHLQNTVWKFLVFGILRLQNIIIDSSKLS